MTHYYAPTLSFGLAIAPPQSKESCGIILMFQY